MASNGVDGGAAADAGKAAWEGAFLQHSPHLSLVSWMSLVMPGQKVMDRADCSMALVP